MLIINNIEKHSEHAVVFPPFRLEVAPGSVVAIHSSTNVRAELMDLFTGAKPVMSGEIISNGEMVHRNNPRYFAETGILFLEDGLYERLKVKEHLDFFLTIYGSTVKLEQLMQIIHLEEKRNVRVSLLSYSEKKRIRYARILIQQPSTVILEEPDQNVDLETKRVFLNIVNMLKQQKTSVVILTANMESALLATESVYRLDHTGLTALDVKPEQEGELVEENGQEEPASVQPVRFEKIPTRVNEKIVLFNPPEIDFIESNEGQSNINVKGDIYPCTFTLNELEQRLLPYGFFRCHRSYIVNLQKVREVVTWTRNSYSLVLDDASQSSIPLSKTKMAELKEMIGLK
ncbi:LytR family transcriptional regulator [Jeotgalibacillus sp. S-D1]|uniref:LytTR family transcriptional regulator DNA-binding domain-containing protein n=1 Tax=Jeotgalibacillus sp. S-D1 TaxID=2552189 RepID=UPI00105A8087|nr:LytTR family transcriptional regulator DNA-binding domain-containing protein [Jeotgalibacillus sp. S-D1]TDL32936.1 LytR family transcriptional regulator [Jeotgalibacillus sp. S-D1]